MTGVNTRQGGLQSQVEQLQTRLSSLAAEAQLADIYEAMGDLDAKLIDLPARLNAIRDRGYVHSRQLEGQLAAIDAEWNDTQPTIEASLRTHTGRLRLELNEVERVMNGLQGNRSAVNAAQSSLNTLQGQISAARDAMRGLYEGVQQELAQVSYQIAVVARMMDLLDESQEIQLLEAEGPLQAVEAEWQRDGDKGPEGVLFLTDQRLIFEQREEIVTKKVLGIFKADSEEWMRVLFDVQISDVESITDKEEGGFLGMGKSDILELVFSAAVPVSRARFHVRGQESADWAAMLKRVQTGEIDKHRADAFVAELEEAEAIAAMFPAQCPNCFADVPVPPRGTKSVICEYCGTAISPQGEA